MMRVLCWDIDGTLLTTNRAGIFAWEGALLETLGTALDLSDWHAPGETDYSIAAALIRKAGGEPTPQLLAATIAQYEWRLPQCLHLRNGHVLPGVREVMDDLLGSPEIISILLTGNTRAGAQAKLEHYGLSGYFREGAFCEGPGSRDDIAQRAFTLASTLARDGEVLATDIFVIGDTPNDVQCGKAIGAHTIAVVNSGFGRLELEESGAWVVLDGLPDPARFKELLFNDKPSSNDLSAAMPAEEPNKPLRRRASLTPEFSPESLRGIRVIEPRQEGVASRLIEFWRYRRLLGYFGRRFLQKNYARTKLGWIWLPLRPTLEVTSRVLVFGSLLMAPSDGIPYVLFFLVGTSAWHFFDRYVMWSTRSLELNRKIVTRLYFSRLTLPVAAIVPAAVELLVYAGLTVVVALYLWVVHGTSSLHIGAATPLALGGLCILALLALGIGLWTSVFGARGRDLRFTLRYVMSFWFFLTPVIYPLSAVPARFQFLASLNPVAAPIEMVKYGILGTGSFGVRSVLISIVAVAVALSSGLWFFAKAEAASVDSL